MPSDPPIPDRTTKDLFRLITENVGELIAVLDTKGKRVFNSPSYDKILGNTVDLIGTDSFADIHPEDRAMVQNAFLDTVQTGVGRSVEYRLMTRGENVRLIQSHGHVLRDSAGIVTNVVVISKDITETKAAERERKSLQEQLRQAQKMEDIGTLAAGVAHDFNNVLAIIMGYATMLEANRIGREELPKAYTNIRLATERGGSLVKQLMAFARKTEVNATPISINQIVLDLVTMLRATFPKMIRIETSLQPSLPEVIADAGQIHQAFLNICINARDAMPHGGTLQISTCAAEKDTKHAGSTERKSFVVVELSDTGDGMDDRTKARAFEPFFTTKDVGKGTGLGLSVVYGVMRGHEGFVELESELGKGTTFSLFFPIAGKAGEKTHVLLSKDTIIPGGNETILFVEDEIMLMGVVRSLLTSNGYKVLTASNGREAIETYRSHSKEIALVISDLGLPELSGWDAFLKMREIDPSVQTVFATGYADERSKREMLQMGVFAVIDKPYNSTRVLRVAREAIDAR